MQTLKIQTQGNTDIINITDRIQNILKKSEKQKGIVNVFVIGSTAGITVIEHEPNLIKDFQEFFDKIIPKGNYYHHETWRDDNGHSHIRASLLGPDITIPFDNNKLILGTWQQIILVDFDTQPRTREVVISVVER
ncbi:YjbQ family protein [Candidatus Pacearchaeota archaeon]|nr:YjbQ family protein [Candidatus Pacearchaeota archaeon]MBD3282755.1 YjbQ family protein [Candidatus Pacearchaeota archaeon]